MHIAGLGGMKMSKKLSMHLTMFFISCIVSCVVIKMKLINYAEKSLGWTGFLFIVLLASLSHLVGEGFPASTGFVLMTLASSSPNKIWLHVSIATSCFLFIYMASKPRETSEEMITSLFKAIIIYEVVRVTAYLAFKIQVFKAVYLYPLVESVSFEVLIALIAFPLLINIETKVYKWLCSRFKYRNI